MATRPKPADPGEIETFQRDLCRWFEELTGTKRRIKTMFDAGEELHAAMSRSTNPLTSEQQRKGEVALDVMLSFSDFRSRSLREPIRSIAQWREHRVATHAPSDDDADRMLPFFDSSDFEALMTDLGLGHEWLSRLVARIDAFSRAEQQREDLLGEGAGVRSRLKEIAALRARVSRLDVELAGIRSALTRGDVAKDCSLTSRGQVRFLREMRGKLRSAGFNPSELPKLLKPRD